MRRLAAQSLRKVCEMDLEGFVPDIVERLSKSLISIETVDIHGGLLALSELAAALKEHDDGKDALECRRKVRTNNV